MADLLPLNSEAIKASVSNATTSATAGSEMVGYRYPPGATDVGPMEVIAALRRYRAAETDMRKRARRTTSMNDTDLAALRYLVSARETERAIGAKDLASLLDISSPSVSVMVERLERNGLIQRRAHPTDRRASVIEPTDAAIAEIDAALGPLHERMLEVVESMSGDEVVAVHRFLTAMTVALEALDLPDH